LDIARACKKSQAPSNYGHGPNPTKTYKVAFLFTITKVHKKSQARVWFWPWSNPTKNHKHLFLLAIVKM
jgi:hypothetical protein